jgi:tRNA A-37 threonylcarbamoyl transferase component Bud32
MTMPAPIHWHMNADLRERLLGPAGLPLADWLRDGTATVIKEAAHRGVYRVRLPGLDFYVKHYRLLGWRGRLRETFRPTKARREFSIAAALQARGVPTPQPLAWGTERTGARPSASWLITETVADTVPLIAYLESQPDARIRQRLSRALGEFLAHLHAAGVVHHDLHPGNLLLRFGPAGEPLLWLIDLHAVSLGSSCPWPVRRDNLVVFNRYFNLRATRSDRLRFWHAYRVARSGAMPTALRGHVSQKPCPRKAVGMAPTGFIVQSVCDGLESRTVARELERLTDLSNARFWQARDGRCLHTNRYYERVRGGPIRGYAVRDLDRSILKSLLTDPDARFCEPDVTVLKDSRSSTVVEFDAIVGGEKKRVVYKRFRITDRRDPWLSLVRRSAAVRSWVFGQGLRERGLPTARPLGVWHRYRNGAPHEGYLLAEKIEQAVDLHEFARRLTAVPRDVAAAELRRRSDVFARLLRHLHARRLSHRDLKASNLLTAESFGDARFWFIDLVGVRRHARVGRLRKVLNLARLNASFLTNPLVTRTLKLRFLLAYLQSGLHGSACWKDRWRAIAAATEVKRAKNVRSGRPLT